MLSLSQTKLLVPYGPCSARSWPPLRKRQFRLLNSQVTNLVIILDSFFSHHISNPSSNPEFIDKTHPEPNYSSSRHPYLVQSIILGLYWQLPKWSPWFTPCSPPGHFPHNHQSNSIRKCRSDHVTLVLKNLPSSFPCHSFITCKSLIRPVWSGLVSLPTSLCSSKLGFLAVGWTCQACPHPRAYVLCPGMFFPQRAA